MNRMMRWGLFLAAAAPICSAAWSNDTTASACVHPSEDRYVVNATQMQVPTVGYTQCEIATGSDVQLCATCTCREKKSASVGGVAVTWVVCVQPQDQAACSATPGREYCANGGNASAANSSTSGSSSHHGVDAGDSTTRPSISPASSSSSGSGDAGVDVGLNSTSASNSGSNSGSIEFGSGSESSVASLTLSPPQDSSQGKNEDNIITSGAVGTVEPSPTATDGGNIIRPGAEKKLDTNNGSSSESSWSSARLTVVASAMCGIAAVAAIAVFVAVRRDRAKKQKMPGTPFDDYTDDDSALATPMTDRVAASRGAYRNNNHPRRANRYYSNGGKHAADSTEDAPLASIVVIGPGNDFVPYATEAQCQTHAIPRKKSSYGQYRSGGSSMSSRSSSGSTSSHHYRAARESSVALSPELGLDTSTTNASFSSGSSGDRYTSPPPSSRRIYDSKGGSSLNDSFRLVSATYSEDDSCTFSTSRGPQTFDTQEEVAPTSTTIVSLGSSLSSLSSLASSQYDVRDTEASEHMHDSEDSIMYTASSRSPMTFDASAVSTEF